MKKKRKNIRASILPIYIFVLCWSHSRLSHFVCWWLLYTVIVCVLIEDFYDIQFSIRLLSSQLGNMANCVLEWEEWKMSLTFLRFRLTYKNLIFHHSLSLRREDDVATINIPLFALNYVLSEAPFPSQFNDLISFIKNVILNSSMIIKWNHHKVDFENLFLAYVIWFLSLKSLFEFFLLSTFNEAWEQILNVETYVACSSFVWRRERWEKLEIQADFHLMCNNAEHSSDRRRQISDKLFSVEKLC